MAMTGEFSSFDDGEIQISIPNYLRPKKGIRYFAARSGQQRHVTTVAMEFQDEHGVKAVLHNLATTQPIEGLGTRQQIVRRGEVQYLPNGYELLVMSQPPDRAALLRFDLIFAIDGRGLYLIVTGGGSVESFSAVCEKIARSVRVASGGTTKAT